MSDCWKKFPSLLHLSEPVLKSYCMIIELEAMWIFKLSFFNLAEFTCQAMGIFN